MSNRRELNRRLVSTLKELERERQYRGLKRYARSLKRKGYLNGKERCFLKGATAYLNRLQADRRASSLGLTEYVPCDERADMFPDIMVHADFRAWDRSVGSSLYKCNV